MRYPRYSNTGVLNTNLSCVKIQNEFLGYSEADFVILPRGSNSYKKSCRLNGYPVTILSDGNEDIGIHVVISGSAIPNVL